MPQKAVDIVLLPEQKITEKAIEINAQLVNKFGPRLVLNPNTCLPHISLVMGCIDDSDIQQIASVLKKIAKENPVGSLEVIDIEAETNSEGEIVLLFKINNTDKLQTLHEQVMEKMLPFFKHQVNDEMMFDSEVELSTLIWIRDYAEKSSFPHFFPHITLGYGKIETTAPRYRFKAVSLALCHLGNHCTCKEILISVPL
ncbi:MAG: 2'-5' RNA ligase family protein [Planctomycetota bacterium]|jgi:2'-5' RNA ligase